MKKYHKILQTITGLAIVLAITLIANAWSEPSSAPPGGNVSAPLNTSATTQTKTGKLNFPWFEDQNQPGYYADPGGNSMFYRLYGLADIRAPIFYDQDNTGYYANPAGESSFNSASFSGAIAANAGVTVDGYTAITDGDVWHNTYGNGGWYNGTYAGGWNMEDTTFVRSYNNKSVYTGGQMRADSGFCIGGNCLTSWPSGAAPIPSGMIAMFDTSCPSGWSRFSQLDGRYPRGSSGYGGTGGSETHSHTLSSNAPGQVTDAPGAYWTTDGGQTERTFLNTSVASNLPPYLDIIFCRKN